jgi:hypothetical protein
LLEELLLLTGRALCLFHLSGKALRQSLCPLGDLIRLLHQLLHLRRLLLQRCLRLHRRVRLLWLLWLPLWLGVR